MNDNERDFTPEFIIYKKKSSAGGLEGEDILLKIKLNIIPLEHIADF